MFNEDFLNPIHVLPNNSVDAIITDPPYLIGYKDWDKQSEDFHILWLQECFRILKPGGTIWSFMAYCSKDGNTFIGYEFYKLFLLRC